MASLPEEMKQLTEYSEQFLLNDLALEKLLGVYTFHEASDWEAKTMNDICKAISLDYPTLSDMQKLASAIKRLNGNKLPKKVNGISHHWVPKNSTGIPFSKTAKTLENINEWLESKL